MTKPNVGGRPLKFETREELIEIINKYFNETSQDEYSVTGLALVVGSKQLIQDYEKRVDFKDIILEAKLIIENSYELSLRKNGGANNIFALKNFGWRDAQEIIDPRFDKIDEVKNQLNNLINEENNKGASGPVSDRREQGERGTDSRAS